MVSHYLDAKYTDTTLLQSMLVLLYQVNTSAKRGPQDSRDPCVRMGSPQLASRSWSRLDVFTRDFIPWQRLPCNEDGKAAPRLLHKPQTEGQPCRAALVNCLPLLFCFCQAVAVNMSSLASVVFLLCPLWVIKAPLAGSGGYNLHLQCSFLSYLL